MPIPRPLATAAPSRVGPVVALIALAAILLPSPSARAQTTYDLQGDQWKARGEPDPASPEGQLLTIRRHLAAAEAVGADARLSSPPNPVTPGAYVEVEALIDLICVVSSCPFDMPRDGWAVNAPGGPTELVMEVR